MDFFELYEEAYSWLFILFQLCWGVTHLISEWDEFGTKLINTFLIIGTVVFFILMCTDDDFVPAIGVLAGGLLAHWIGSGISESIDDGDWMGVAAVVGIISFIVMFILIGVAL